MSKKYLSLCNRLQLFLNVKKMRYLKGQKQLEIEAVEKENRL